LKQGQKDKGESMYTLVISHCGVVSSKRFDTEREAWDAKDTAHMMGFDCVQVFGVPTTGIAIVPVEKDRLNIVE
jgi:hypothetical protein